MGGFCRPAISGSCVRYAQMKPIKGSNSPDTITGTLVPEKIMGHRGGDWLFGDPEHRQG